ncbi:low specificity L-threonine aldolase [Rhodobacteraceae bacterium NNCM2]|nr:low specificity L-threonine aldolase [Coraliihabitans acroporae]
MFFTSDNAAGAAPQILEAVGRAGEGFAWAYGADPTTDRVEELVREVFEAPEARAFSVATGTAANSLALACLCPPWGTVFCHDVSHIEVDECGGPEFFTGGAKLTLLEGDNAKMRPAVVARALAKGAAASVHNVQNGAVSITQATELGSIYTIDEIAEICRAAKEHGMPVHMDGTRFANAVARTGASPAEMSWKAGVDILCLGATKNGALAAETVILFNPDHAREFELRRKRGGHLFSKMRFVSAQVEAYLTDGLWLDLAHHANAMADRLAAGIAAIEGAEVTNKVEANLLFVNMNLAQHRRLQAAGAQYYPMNIEQSEDGPDDAPWDVRLVTSFQTTEAEVDRFLDVMTG